MTANSTTCLTQTTCADTDREQLHYVHTVRHLPDNRVAPEFVRIVDEISIEVSGTVFVSQDHECGLDGVAVSAINTRHPYNTICETYTNKLGEFKLSLPKHTHARLELEYHGHVFAAENDDGRKYLTEEGVVLTVAETNLRIADTNMSSFTIQTGVADCALVFTIQMENRVLVFVIVHLDCNIVVVVSYEIGHGDPFRARLPSEDHLFDFGSKFTFEKLVLKFLGADFFRTRL